MTTRPHICLKCQLQLARWVPSRIQASFYSTATNQRNPPNHPAGENGEQDETISRPFIRPQYLHQTTVSRRPLRTQYPMVKLHGVHGKKLREERERLNIRALGEPADVIVLRDSKVRTYNHMEIVESDEEPQSIDILATLDSERGLPGPQEVEENINQFRPKEGEGPQDWDAFNTLVKDLQASFTISQLARYIQSFDKARGDDPSMTRDRLWIPRLSPWMPVTSQPTQRSDHNYTRGYSLASYTNKQRLVLRLLRECWKVEVPELEAGMGEVELELKPKDYDLLLRSSRPMLGLIASEYINGEDERIDGFRSKHTIRITATRQKSEVIISEIEQVVQNIRREDIYLGDLMQPGHNWQQLRKWADAQFNSTTIKHLSRMTNTEIDELPKKRLLISCIDQKPGAAKGNRIDIVLRLLVTSANFSNRVTNWLGCRETTKKSSGMFVMHTAVEGLGWRDRLRQWTRWTAPIAKRADDMDKPEDSIAVLEGPADQKALSPMENEEPEPVKGATEITHAVEEMQATQTEASSSWGRPETKPEHFVHWKHSYGVESSAVIGSVLHSHANPANASTLAPQPSGEVVEVHRAFSTAVPNLSRILGSSSTRGIRRKPHRTLIMHFQPNPFSKSPKTSKPLSAAALSAFPPIEMRFSIDPDTNTFKVRDIQAVISVSISDLMLPESASDVRFQQRSVSTLTPRRRGATYPPGITEFLSNASLDIGNGNFDAPAKLAIPIAAHLCEGAGFELLGEGGAASTTDTRDVEYLFTGLEVRKTVMMDYKGWRLHYTSIEAGKAGGRRGELRLLPVRLGKTARPATEEEFVEAACRLADGVEGGGVQANLARKVRAAKPVTKVWVDPEPEPEPELNEAGARAKYFNKRVDIRHPLARMADEANAQEMGELERVEYRFGEEGDEDAFV